MPGTNRVAGTTASTLVLTIRSSPAGSASPDRPIVVKPALLTRTSAVSPSSSDPAGRPACLLVGQVGGQHLGSDAVGLVQLGGEARSSGSRRATRVTPRPQASARAISAPIPRRAGHEARPVGGGRGRPWARAVAHRRGRAGPAPRFAGATRAGARPCRPARWSSPCERVGVQRRWPGGLRGGGHPAALGLRLRADGRPAAVAGHRHQGRWPVVAGGPGRHHPDGRAPAPPHRPARGEATAVPGRSWACRSGSLSCRVPAAPPLQVSVSVVVNSWPSPSSPPGFRLRRESPRTEVGAGFVSGMITSIGVGGPPVVIVTTGGRAQAARLPATTVVLPGVQPDRASSPPGVVADSTWAAGLVAVPAARRHPRLRARRPPGPHRAVPGARARPPSSAAVVSCPGPLVT